MDCIFQPAKSWWFHPTPSCRETRRCFWRSVEGRMVWRMVAKCWSTSFYRLLYLASDENGSRTGHGLGCLCFSWYVYTPFSCLLACFANPFLALGTYYQTSVRRFRRNVRDDIQRELIKNDMAAGFESMDWLNTFLGKTLSGAEPLCLL